MTTRVLSVLIRHDGGGAERAVGRLIAPLAELGLEMTTVALDPPAVGEDATERPVLGRSSGPSVLSVLSQAARLRRQVQSSRPDILHLHCERPELVGLLAQLTIRGRPHLVVTQHSTVEWAAAPRLGSAVRHLLARLGAELVSCHDIGTPPGRRVIPNPAEHTAHWVGAPADGVVRRLLMVGRVNAVKRVEEVVAGLAGMTDPPPLLVVGDGDRVPAVRLAAERTGVDVTLTGFSKDPWQHARAGDVFVTASAHEGEPLALVEAVRRGLPVVASDIPAHRRLLGSTHPLFEHPGELAELITSLRTSGVARYAVSAEARADLVSAREPLVVAARWREIYEGVAGRNPGGAL